MWGCYLSSLHFEITYAPGLQTSLFYTGLEPVHENWGDLNLGETIDEGGDPPRVWSPKGDYPGTAFTRSLGDCVAEECGVIAEPEILER